MSKRTASPNTDELNKRPRNEEETNPGRKLTDMDVREPYTYTFNPKDEIYFAASSINVVMEINERKLNIDKSCNIFEKWAVIGNDDLWYYEGVLNLVDCEIASMIPGYEACDTLEIISQNKSLRARLYKRSEGVSGLYLEFKTSFGEYNQFNNQNFRDFITGLSFVPKSVLSETKTLLRGNDGKNDEMPFKLDFNDIHSATEISLNEPDHLTWNATLFENARGFSRGYYELRNGSLIEPKKNEYKLLVEFIKGDETQGQFLIAIYLLVNHGIVKFHGIGEEYTWGYSSFNGVIDDVLSKLINLFIKKHYQSRTGKHWTTGNWADGFQAHYSQTLSDIENITNRIVRLTSMYPQIF